MHAPSQPERPGQLDTWIALLAGERVWRVNDHEATSHERGIASVMVGAVVISFLFTAVAAAQSIDPGSAWGDHERRTLVLLVANGMAGAVLVVRPIEIMTDRLGRTASFVPSIVVRTLAFIVLAATTATLLPRWRFLGGLQLGLVAGPDILLGALALGIAPSPWRWVGRFAWSTPHFGAIGAAIAMVFLHPYDSAALTALHVYVGMWLSILTAAAIIAWLQRMRQLVDTEQDDLVAGIREQERTKRGHWLHDDVLSEVRLATLRIDGTNGSIESTRRELLDLDHRLRLRQLDEAIRDGTPHLHEVLQPHIRRLQALGIDVLTVPHLELTDLRVDEPSAHLVNRTVAVLTSNAANAGATSVGLTMIVHDGPPRLRIEVSDDAGGFELASIPRGRGLSRLRDDLGDGSLERTDTARGSAVAVTVPIRGPFGDRELAQAMREAPEHATTSTAPKVAT